MILGSDPHRPQGCDSVNPYVLKEEGVVFKNSLNTGKVLPKEWLEAYVTSIFKKGSQTDPNNYRPISLTSIIC